MSVRWTPPTELTPREERLCTRLEKHRRFFRFLRLHRHRLFDDAFQTELLALYSDSPRGTPPLPPARLAAVVLLQAYADVSDEDAVQFAETDARWQMVLDCLGEEEAPFKKTTLVDFRARLTRAGAHNALLRRTVDLAKQTHDFGARQAAALRIAVDSVPRAGAGRVEDTLNLLGRALRMLAIAAATMLALPPRELIAQVPLPVLAAPSIKAGLDQAWGTPGANDAALTTLCHQIEDLQTWLRRRAPAGLRTYAVAQADQQLMRLQQQDIEADERGGWRIRQAVAPDRQISLSDPQMRHGRKSASTRIDGYKEYLAVDLDSGLTMAAGVLPANAAEHLGADKLRAAVEAHGFVAELAIDRAFLPSAWVGAVEDAAGRIVCRPYELPNHGRFAKRDFAIDVDAGTVRCPANQLAVIRGGQALFDAAACGACALRSRCQAPGAKVGRSIQIHTRESLLQRLSTAAATPEGRAKLRKRVPVEHALAHQRRRRGERARYRGIEKNDFDACRIAAVNNLLVIDRRVRIAQDARDAA